MRKSVNEAPWLFQAQPWSPTFMLPQPHKFRPSHTPLLIQELSPSLNSPELLMKPLGTEALPSLEHRAEADQVLGPAPALGQPCR